MTSFQHEEYPDSLLVPFWISHKDNDNVHDSFLFMLSMDLAYGSKKMKKSDESYVFNCPLQSEEISCNRDDNNTI